MDVFATQFPPGSVYHVEQWPRGTLGGDMLNHMTRFDQSNAPIVVDVETWQEAVDHVVEHWCAAPDSGVSVETDPDARAAAVHRYAQDPKTGQTLLVWKDGTAVLARVEAGRFFVHPEVLVCSDPSLGSWWEQDMPRVAWERVPQPHTLAEITDMQCAPAYLPHHSGIIAAWANLCWVYPSASPLITETLVDAACWVGMETDVWPKKWVALVQARAVSASGEMTEPQLFWKDRFAQTEDGVVIDEEDETDDGLWESGQPVAADNPAAASAQVSHQEPAQAIDEDPCAPTKPSYQEVQARAMSALRRWLSSARSPLAGVWGVQHGFAEKHRDKAGFVLAALIAPPTDWTLEERAARASEFAARFIEENVATVSMFANML